MSPFVTNVAKILTYALWGNDSGSNQVAIAIARKLRKLCQPATPFQVLQVYEKFSIVRCASIPEGGTIGSRQASNLSWHPLQFSVSCTFIDSWITRRVLVWQNLLLLTMLLAGPYGPGLPFLTDITPTPKVPRYS